MLPLILAAMSSPQGQSLMADGMAQSKKGIVSDLTKSLKDIGTQILGELTHCKVKPKGTKHEEIYKRAPKYFVQYGEGIPESGNFPLRAVSGIFEPVTGFQLSQSQLEKILPEADRRKIEASLRKKCERVTGSFAYYIEVRPAASFKGYVRLKDNNVYDGATYGLNGGGSGNATKFSDVVPIVLPGQEDYLAKKLGVGVDGTPIKTAGILGGISPVFLIIGVILAIGFSMGK